MNRECGVLLPISCLPSNYGIGAFSKEAYEFVDQLSVAGQRYWQILPLGPTGFGDSPYQSFSAFAGNPYFIDLETLIEEKLLTKKECQAVDFGSKKQDIAYDKIYEGRFPLLRKAYERYKEKKGGLKEVHKKAKRTLQSETLEYCLYMAVKNHFDSKSWNLWDKEIRLREPDAMELYRAKLDDEIGFYEFQQLKFEQQWKKLKKYANKKNIKIIGDIPIYVAFDGADSWASPEMFQFDEENLPIEVAGCPPDAFSATGQLWGNPLYDWEYHKETEYSWWIERMKYCFRMYDLVRVDHFRGFDEYYAIPYAEETAMNGTWKKGPGIGLFQAMEASFGTKDLPIIAEDLGFLTPSVLQLLEDSGFPGMKVIEFAFDSREASDYLPHNYGKNCVVYTGTHDNETLVQWYDTMSKKDREFSKEYMGNHRTPKDEIHWDFIRMALSSTANLAVIPIQDYLGLDKKARINVPSTLGTNWRWRMKKNQIEKPLLKKMKRMAHIYGRLPS